MMRFHVLSVHDRAADVFATPTFHLSVGSAIRAFTDEINRDDPGNILFKHSEDFDLYDMGTFLDNTGMFEVGIPRLIAVGKDVSFIKTGAVSPRL